MYDPKDDVKAIIAIADCGKAFADCGTTTIEASAKFGSFLSKVFGVTIEDAAGILGDQLKYLRWKRQNRLVDKVNEYLEKKGSTTLRPISPKFAIPFILNASMEEDDDLQDIWCRLIANALDSKFKSEIRFAYIDIIKNLNSLDAKVLKFAYDEVSRKIIVPYDEPIKIYMTKMIVDLKNINKYLDVSEEELTISYNNLIRVQCLKLAISLNSLLVEEGESMPLMLSDPMHVTLTPLGIAFIEACMKEKE